MPPQKKVLKENSYLLNACCELSLPQISWVKLDKIINLYLYIYAVEHFYLILFDTIDNSHKTHLAQKIKNKKGINTHPAFSTPAHGLKSHSQAHSECFRLLAFFSKQKEIKNRKHKNIFVYGDKDNTPVKTFFVTIYIRLPQCNHYEIKKKFF